MTNNLESNDFAAATVELLLTKPYKFHNFPYKFHTFPCKSSGVHSYDVQSVTIQPSLIMSIKEVTRFGTLCTQVYYLDGKTLNDFDTTYSVQDVLNIID